jgi:hypothetical protein
MIVHLNDDHSWSREQIAAWLDGAAPAQANGQAAGRSEGSQAGEKDGPK